MKKPLRSITPLMLVLCLVFVTLASANTITVNTTDDIMQPNGNCSLRDAITAANLDVATDTCAAGFGDDYIVFDRSLNGQTISVTHAAPNLPDSSLRVEGNLEIDGGGTITVEGLPNLHLLDVF